MKYNLQSYQHVVDLTVATYTSTILNILKSFIHLCAKTCLSCPFTFRQDCKPKRGMVKVM